MFPKPSFSWNATCQCILLDYLQYMVWVQRAVEQGFARSEEMQQKVAGSEAELCLGAQPRLWQSCCAGAAQPGRRGAVCQSASIPRLLCSIQAWLLPTTCTAPADEQELLPPPQCLSSCASSSCCSTEAKPTVSSAAAGFLPPHSCIWLFLAVPPSKSKKPQ